jgi:hypothetical protein
MAWLPAQNRSMNCAAETLIATSCFVRLLHLSHSAFTDAHGNLREAEFVSERAIQLTQVSIADQRTDKRLCYGVSGSYSSIGDPVVGKYPLWFMIGSVFVGPRRIVSE